MNKKSMALMNWRNRTKIKLIEYKGGKCEICGFNKQIPVLFDFHHRDPQKKDFSISGKSWGYKRLQAEADKCDLLCKNCHAELHWNEQQTERDYRMNAVKSPVPLPMRDCLNCKKEFQSKSRKQKYCSHFCMNYKRRKVVHPSKKVLQEEMRHFNWCELGRKYGVSDNAVRKWARKYDLIY